MSSKISKIKASCLKGVFIVSPDNAPSRRDIVHKSIF